jgi:DNA transposition AAA+ family ATPase
MTEQRNPDAQGADTATQAHPCAPTSLTPAEVAERVAAVMAAEGIAQAQVAREAGLNPTILSPFLRGKYPGDNQGTASRLAAWLNTRAGRTGAVSVMPQAPDWQPTPTARTILGALEYAHHFADIAIVFGGAGLGKTTTIRHYAAGATPVWVVTVSPATAGLGVMLEEVALAMGIKDPALHPARLQREIVRRARDTGGLLIVDEAQHLTVQSLEALRSLHDAAGVGLVLSGNVKVFDRLHGGAKREDFAQLFSRLGRKVRLTAPKQGDVDALARGYGFDDLAALRFLRERALQAGALRGIVKAMRLAVTIAAGAGEEPAVAHLDRAWRELDAA